MGPRHHTMKLGSRRPGDIQLYSEKVRKGDEFLSIVSHTFTYTARDNEEITHVVAEDQWTDDTGGNPEIVSGGVGHEEVTIRVSSIRNRGFDFHFYVYGFRKVSSEEKIQENQECMYVVTFSYGLNSGYWP